MDPPAAEARKQAISTISIRNISMGKTMGSNGRPSSSIWLFCLGDGCNVPLLDEEEALIKTFGIIMIHCHPLTYLEGKIDTFSPNDLMLLYKLGIPESRVVFGSEVFVWKRGKKRVNKKIVINKLEEILELLKSDKMTATEFQEDEIIKLAKEYRAEYYKEKIK